MFGTFRDYSNQQVKHFDKIALFYKELHEKQTVDYVLRKRAEYAPLNKLVRASIRSGARLTHCRRRQSGRRWTCWRTVPRWTKATQTRKARRTCTLTRQRRPAAACTPTRSTTGFTSPASYTTSLRLAYPRCSCLTGLRLCPTHTLASHSGQRSATRTPWAAPSLSSLSTPSSSPATRTRRMRVITRSSE